MFSSRSSFDLSPNRLSTELARARARERAILDMTESNPTRAGIPYEGDAIVASLASYESLRYQPMPFGSERAREAVARDLRALGQDVDPARIVLTASTSEAYAFLFKLLADPGDEVLVPAPSYPLLDHLAQLESVRVVPYRLEYDGAWHIDLASAKSAVSRRTRAVVVVSPNNPTGSYVKREEIIELASFGLPIVSDEVFAQYALRESAIQVAPSMLGAPAPLTFVLGGLSKLAGLPQMKLAWMVVAGEKPRVEAALARLEIISDAFLSVGTPVQEALPTLLACRATAEQAILGRIRANLAHIRDAVAGSEVSLLDVEGGWYATLRLPSTQSEERWALELLEKDGVYVHPGHYFDFAEEPYAVCSLLTKEDALKEGVRRLVARMRQT